MTDIISNLNLTNGKISKFLPFPPFLSRDHKENHNNSPNVRFVVLHIIIINLTPLFLHIYGNFSPRHVRVRSDPTSCRQKNTYNFCLNE